MAERKSTTLKATFALLACLFLSACGGGSLSPSPSMRTHPATTPAAASPTTIISSVFTPPAPGTSAPWYFQDSYGHWLQITVSAVPCAFGVCDSDIVIWHFQKDSCAGYWNPRTPAQCAVAVALDELWFVLHRGADGAWRCIGFSYIDYLGIKRKVQILTPPNSAPPYTIIPSDSATSDAPTSYSAIVQMLPHDADMTDFSVPIGAITYSTSWQTTTGIEQISVAGVMQNALISDQNEGCVHEHWSYVASAVQPLVSIRPIVGLGDNGACVNMDPGLTMQIALSPMTPAFLGLPEKP